MAMTKNCMKASLPRRQPLGLLAGRGAKAETLVKTANPRMVRLWGAAGVLALQLLLALPGAAQAQFTYVTNDGAITITGYTGTGGAVAIPSSINGLPVTSIENAAFYGYTNLTSVAIPDSVTNIGTFAFYWCIGLTNVTIPSSVTSIELGVFASCAGLPGVVIPNSVSSIGQEAFADCTGLTNVTISTSVTSMGNWAFAGCSVLPSLAIPDTVTNIGYRAFSGCTSLSIMRVPNSVTHIGAGAFSLCTNLWAIIVETRNPAYCDVDGVLFDRGQTTLVAYPGGINGSYAIPDSVTSIGDKAFVECTGLTSVTIPNGVTNIGDGAFAGCTSLASVTIPNSVISIVDGAFGNCTGLTNVTIGSGVISLGDYVFAGCTGLTSVAIPNSVTSIGGFAFQNCASLTSVTLPNSVTNIRFGTFQNCTALARITIPSSVTSIEDYAFWGCTSLTGLYFRGNAPIPGWIILVGASPPTAYFLPGAIWWTNYAGLPTAVWQPELLVGNGGTGVPTNGFGFTVAWASGMTVVVEASSDLAHPVWFPLQTNLLTSDFYYFPDPAWTDYQRRFYRLRSP